MTGQPTAPVRERNRCYEHLTDLFIRLAVATHDADANKKGITGLIALPLRPRVRWPRRYGR